MRLQVNGLGIYITVARLRNIYERVDGEVGVVLVSLDPPENAVRGLYAAELEQPEELVGVQTHGQQGVGTRRGASVPSVEVVRGGYTHSLVVIGLEQELALRAAVASISEEIGNALFDGCVAYLFIRASSSVVRALVTNSS